MSEWVTANVSDVTSYQKAGGTPTTGNTSFYGGDIPFVIIEDITNSKRYLDETEKSLTLTGLRNSAAWLIKGPHILYSMYATVGKPIINRIECATNQAIIALKENEKIELDFLFYQLLFIRPSVHKYTAQTTQSNLNASVVKKLPILYPINKEVQKKIIRILSSIDDTIEKTEILIEKYQQVKAGLMHDLFTRGITADGKLRPSREQAPELYQETKIGWIPKEWEVCSISELAHPRKGSTVIGPFGSDLVMSDYRTEGTPIIFVRDVKEDRFAWKSNVFISERKTQALSAHRVKSGDILATKMGLPPCVAAVYPEDMPMGIITADMIRMTPDPSKAYAKWLGSTLNHDRSKRQVAAITAGVTRQKVTLADFRSLKVAVPSLEEQERKIKSIDSSQMLIAHELQNLEKLLKQKLGLMHDLLTGKVPVSLDEERAHV